MTLVVVAGIPTVACAVQSGRTPVGAVKVDVSGDGLSFGGTVQALASVVEDAEQGTIALAANLCVRVS